MTDIQGYAVIVFVPANLARPPRLALETAKKIRADIVQVLGRNWRDINKACVIERVTTQEPRPIDSMLPMMKQGGAQ